MRGREKCCKYTLFCLCVGVQVTTNENLHMFLLRGLVEPSEYFFSFYELVTVLRFCENTMTKFYGEKRGIDYNMCV